MKNLDRSFLDLYLVTNRRGRSHDEYSKFILEAVRGGVTCIQLRDKEASDQELIDTASNLLKILKPFSIPLIINDRVDIARKVGAHGVHLGYADMPPEAARMFLGEDAIIGISIESLDHLKAIESNDINPTYVAASAVFETSSKNNCEIIWGLDGLEIVCKKSKYPVVAIGGINASNIEDVLRAGANGVAVISAIDGASDPYAAARELAVFFRKESFTESLWMDNLKLYEKTLNMPFNQELAKGTLAIDKFKHYIVQDALYLKSFSRCMGILSEKASIQEDKDFWNRCIDDTINAEALVHEYFVKSLGGSMQEILDAIKTIITDSYTEFLISTCAKESYEEGVAAVLPCFWIYNEIGKDLLKISAAGGNNPYQKWIDNYSGKEFEEAVNKAKSIANRCAETGSIARMREAYRRGAELEYMFWQDAYGYKELNEVIC